MSKHDEEGLKAVTQAEFPNDDEEVRECIRGMMRAYAEHYAATVLQRLARARVKLYDDDGRIYWTIGNMQSGEGVASLLAALEDDDD